MSGGRRFRLAERCDRRSRQKVEPSHGFHTDAKATDRGIGGQFADLGLDRRKNAGDLVGRSSQIINRTNPERDRPNL
jgi:hypothetical protein